MSALADVITLEGAAVVAAVSALGAGIAKVWPAITRLTRFLDDIQGEPERPGSPARPGWGERLLSIEQRLTRVEDKTDRVRAQTENSHNTNLRDDLDQIDAKVTDLHQKYTRSIPHVRHVRKESR